MSIRRIERRIWVRSAAGEEIRLIHEFKRSELDFLVRPSGFEPETCGLRVRGRGVQGVRIRLLSWDSIFGLSIELSVSRPYIAEIVGEIVGRR